MEQLLISDAIDRSIAKIDFRPLAGSGVRRRAVPRLRRQGLRRQQAAPPRDDLRRPARRQTPTTPTASARFAAAASARTGRKSYVGTPNISLPGIMPVEIPEMKVWNRDRQMATAKIGVMVYDAKTRTPLGPGGMSLARSDDCEHLPDGRRPVAERQREETIHRQGENAGRSSNPLPYHVAVDVPPPGIAACDWPQGNADAPAPTPAPAAEPAKRRPRPVDRATAVFGAADLRLTSHKSIEPRFADSVLTAPHRAAEERGSSHRDRPGYAPRPPRPPARPTDEYRPPAAAGSARSAARIGLPPAPAASAGPTHASGVAPAGVAHGPRPLPAALWFVPHRVPLSPTLRGILLAAIAVWPAWSGRMADRPAGGRRRRRRAAPAVFGYAGGVLLTLLCFPDRPECGFAVLAVLAFGDGSATLFGKLVRRHAVARRSALEPRQIVGRAAAPSCCAARPTAAPATAARSLNPDALTPPADWPTAFSGRPLAALCRRPVGERPQPVERQRPRGRSPRPSASWRPTPVGGFDPREGSL